MTNKKKDSLFSKLKGKLFSSSEDDDFEIVEDEIDSSELEDYEARYHTDDDEDFEAFEDDLSDEEREAILREDLGEDYSPVINEDLIASSEEIAEEDDKTDPGFVMSQEITEDEADIVEEDLSFPDDEEVLDSEFADDSDDDEVLEALESEAPLSLEDEDIEEEEGVEYTDLDDTDLEDDDSFEPQPMVLSEDAKEELDDEFPDIPQEMPTPDPTREIDLEELQSQTEELEYEEDENFDEEQVDFNEFKVPGQKPSLKDKVMGLGGSLKSMLAKKGSKPSFTPRKPSKFKLPENFEWDNVYNKIFAMESRPAIHRGFLAILFALSTYGLGKITALAIKGTAPQTAASSLPSMSKVSYQARPAMKTVAMTDLFNAPGEVQVKDPLKKRITKKVDEKKVCATSNKQSNLSITLVNTLVLQDSVKSIAAVQVRNDKQVLNIREGEKIKDMAQIGRIDRQKMVFKNLKTGTCEYIANEDKKLKRMSPLEILRPTQGKKLMNSQKKSGIKNAGHSYKIPGKVREEMLTNISEVLTQARAIQINNPDGSLSFKITEIVPNSIYSKLDIQNDDIVSSINGKKITNINEVMTLFGNIRQIDHFELGILRNGAEVNKEYDFE